jgi:hypothetical protein
MYALRCFLSAIRCGLMVSRSFLFLVFSVILTVSIAPSGQAQGVRAWGASGLGLSAASRGTGASGHSGLHVLIDHLMLTARVTVNNGGGSEQASGLLGGHFRDTFYDVGGLVGYARSTGNTTLAVGGGPSVLWGERMTGVSDPGPCFGIICPGSQPIVEGVGRVVGLAVEAGAYFHLTRYLGLNVVFHGNANREQSLAGLTLGLTVGKLRGAADP